MKRIASFLLVLLYVGLASAQVQTLEQIRVKGVTSSNVRVVKRKAPKVENEVFKLKNGYKGFISAGVGPCLSNEAFNGVFNISTSHGYQFNPNLYIGLGLNNYGKIFKDFGKNTNAFFNARLSTSTRTSFFGDVKIGTRIFDGNTPYFSIGMGPRFVISERSGFMFSLSYSMIRVRDKDINHAIIKDGILKYKTLTNNHVMLNFGFDF